ncbi:MAG: LysR family transcriptional regulator [Pigmentiphaga sp.]|uniref:LysR family transcriptional regulator n=1 Tax=Pigmentiphaga sp. TaxID=1977564 RepID=UPI0029B1158D|nr:LysR family transcriptional regulator [Pigmentiphaga sp.]MDX3906387.1 LysR family transcriptional regulator [Pigmentiphaga sp.]
MNTLTLRTTLEQWRILQAIVDHGGYAQAAQALHRSQSSLSYMVAKLQEQVGVEILAIEGRKARLTEKGKVLLEEAIGLLNEARQLELLAQSLGKGREPEIRLVVDMAFPTPLLLRALTRFMEAAEQTRVQLSEVVLSGADEALVKGRADIVVGTRVPTGFLGDLILDIEFVAVAAPHHPLHGLSWSLTTEDLKKHMQVVIRDSGTVSPRDDGWLGAPRRWTVTGMETSLQMVCTGLGYAWLPRHLVATELAAGHLLELPLDKGGTRRVPLYLMFGNPSDVGPAARHMANLLTEVAADFEPG